MSYLSQISPEYLEQLRELYRQDPQLVPASWRVFFDGMEFGEELHESAEYEKPAVNGHANGHTNGAALTNGAATKQISGAAGDSQLQARILIDNYRRLGHHKAKISPLGTAQRTGIIPQLKKLDASGSDLNSKVTLPGFQGETLKDVVAKLEKTYCGPLGAEFTYIDDDTVVDWLTQKLESVQSQPQLSKEEKVQILKSLTKAEVFETFLQKAYTGQKRFSLEGGESLIPSLERVNQVFAQNGGAEVVFGMAHRGRLNVLTNIMKKPYGSIFAEFDGLKKPDFEGGGDVKYHLGYSSDVEYDGRKLHLSLAFNPSHLEAVNPVVEGMARAKQMRTYDGDFSKVLPVLIHGDAAVVGQGVVAETLNMAGLDGYRTGGTVHLVINNQIGFTTDPIEARTGNYCTDFAKALQAPILHVNGNKPEHVVFAAQVASEFRVKFQRDVFVDIYCYRKYGHNEGDEPRFTQPQMYNEIGAIKSPRATYAEELVQAGVITEEESKKIVQDFSNELEATLTQIKKGELPPPLVPFKSLWDGFKAGTEAEMVTNVNSAISEDQFKQVIDVIHPPFEGTKLLPKLQKVLETRKETILKENTLDWAAGEQLAFGSLLMDGYSVRLSGQDARRGTFSHRHLVVTDHENGQKLIPLKSLQAKGSVLSAWNSPLSEFSVMGFDYGFSLSDPKTLVLWEGQFGDFVNSAQVIIDQFIVSSEKKWNRHSGLTLLLPHGYEGQGPEHSSARLERFLQQCADANIQVAYPTTPAQYMHLLRRQMVRKFRKPLIIMAPKSPLRMPEVVSKKEDFTNGSFQTLLVSGAEASKAKRVVVCSGKVYWDLQKEAKTKGVDGQTAFIRVEQLYPLDKVQLQELAKKYAKATWVWAQEEPQNMGAWSFIRLNTLEFLNLTYAGRKANASPATGSPKMHISELEQLLKEALGT
ncbi:MAG: 2-oxoglutarate dehydrogenase E1 component [Bdellovibrionales bacterium]